MRTRRIKYPELAKALALETRPQYAVATAAGMAPPTFSAIVCGRSMPTLSQRDAIAEALGVDAKKLFTEAK